MITKNTFANHLRLLALIVVLTLNQSCYHYIVATKDQPSTSTIAGKKFAQSFLWGLYQKPVVIQTTVCDSLETNGISEVRVTTNLGYILITVITLGIYCPMQVEWYCSKPCQQEGHL